MGATEFVKKKVAELKAGHDQRQSAREQASRIRKENYERGREEGLKQAAYEKGKQQGTREGMGQTGVRGLFNRPQQTHTVRTVTSRGKGKNKRTTTSYREEPVKKKGGYSVTEDLGNLAGAFGKGTESSFGFGGTGASADDFWGGSKKKKRDFSDLEF